MRRIFSSTAARQGKPGIPVLLVLVVSLALACAVWFAVELYGNSIQSPRTDASPATAGSTSQTGG
jgi:hypothetical protein